MKPIGTDGPRIRLEVDHVSEAAKTKNAESCFPLGIASSSVNKIANRIKPVRIASLLFGKSSRLILDIRETTGDGFRSWARGDNVAKRDESFCDGGVS